MAKYKKAIEPPAETPDLDDTLTIGVAVAFLAQRCKPRHDSLRDFKNRARGRLAYGIATSQLAGTDTTVVFFDLVTWAKAIPSFTAGLEDIKLPIRGAIDVKLPLPAADFHAIALPTTLEACHQALIAADKKIGALQAQLALTQAQLLEQEPYVKTGRLVRRKRKKS